MKKLTYILLAFTVLSCMERKPKTEVIEADNLSQEQIDSVLAEFKFEYTNPVFIDSSEQVLLPITTQLLERRKSFSRDGYYSDDYPRYWNILFYNKTNGQTRLLTESKFRISDYSVNLKKTGNLLSKSILYRIGDTDYNNDKKLDGKDPEQLFISNADGSGLRRLSPINEDLESFTVIPNSDQLIVRTTRDINQDLKFDKDDEAIWYRIDLDADSKPVEMVDSIDRKKIQNLYFDQWLKKK